MNYNVVSYCIYSLITIFIIYKVGKLCYTHGRVFILQLFEGDESVTDTTNNILLMAYYLFNVGYAIIQFSYWVKVNNLAELISSIAMKSGVLIIILAVTHYCNTATLFLLSKKKKYLSQKTHQLWKI